MKCDKVNTVLGVKSYNINKILEKDVLPTAEETEALLTTLRISPEVAVTPVATTVGNTTYYTYAYDGLAFVVKAEVDAIQTHNYEKAIRSAWGLADNSIINAMK